jgi:cytochrome c-type biogenesis protein CcmH
MMLQSIAKRVLTLSLLMLLAVSAFAVEPDEVLDDPLLEERARIISVDLRCLVCQNQSIDGSNADLARDLRVLVRKRLVEGDSNEQVIAYVVSRYGDFVLLKPSFSLKNLLLWITPALVLFIFAFVAFRKWRMTDDKNVNAPLSQDEKDKLKQLLNE